MLQNRNINDAFYYYNVWRKIKKSPLISILLVKVIDIWKIMCNFAFAFCGNESARRIIN